MYLQLYTLTELHWVAHSKKNHPFLKTFQKIHQLQV